jgi:hypothetical protein
MSDVHSSSDTSTTAAAASISAAVQGTHLESRGRASYRSIGVESYLNGYHAFSGNVGGLATWYEGPNTYAISTAVDEFTVSSPGETSGIMNLNFNLEGSLWKTWAGRPELRITAEANQSGNTIMTMMQIYTDLNGTVNQAVQTPAFTFLTGVPIQIRWSLNANSQLPTDKFVNLYASGSAFSGFYGTATLNSVSVRNGAGDALPWSATSASGTDYTLMVVPEPSVAMIGCGSLILALRRQRRDRAA